MSPKPTGAGAEPSGRSGYVLVVSLLMMSLILVLILGISAVAQVETRSAGLGIYQLEAKENARLALMVALGELKQSAGPDRRVTARAEVLGSGNYQPTAKYWTGVWNSENTGEAPVWLVSGDLGPSFIPEREVAIFPAANGANLEAEESEPVVVGAELVNDELEDRSSRYAWWVSEEGAKANVVAARRASERFLPNERGAVEFQIPFGVDLETLLGDHDFDASYTDTANVSFESELLFLRDSGDNPIAESDELARLAHDLTTTSFGVLENPVAGGLKSNLSDRNIPRDTLLASDPFFEILDYPYSEGIEVEAGSLESADGEDPTFSPRPFPTEIVLYIGLFHMGGDLEDGGEVTGDGRIRIRFHLRAEFLNPYPAPLKFPVDQNTNYSRGMDIYFENLPTITVEDLSGVGPKMEDNLDDMFLSTNNPNRDRIHSWIDFAPDLDASYAQADLTPVIQPGEVYDVMEPNPAPEPEGQPRGLVRTFEGGKLAWIRGDPKNPATRTRPEDNAKILVTAIHPEAGVNIIGVPFFAPGEVEDREPIFEIRNLKFSNFKRVFTFKGGAQPFTRALSSDYTFDDYVFAYHFRLKSDEADGDSLRDLLYSVDLRYPVFDAEGSFVDSEGNERPMTDLLDPIDDDPSLIIKDDSDLFSGLDIFTDPKWRSHDPGYREMVLYDLPSEEPVSLASMSSVLMYPRQPPRKLGGSRGGDANKAFDTYYLSPKEPETGDPEVAVVLNPLIQSIDEASTVASFDDARNELLEGAFNINSLSKEAWTALLNAPVVTDEASDLGGIGSNFRKGTFFRLPFHEAGLRESSSITGRTIAADQESFSPGLGEGADKAFSQGLRVLSSEADDPANPQVENLAGRIVANIEKEILSSGRPFDSVQAFLESGLLAASIDEVGSDEDTSPTKAEAINLEVYGFSNVYLTEPDLFAKIAPLATVRSDTFTIRAYGDAVNPATGLVEAEAYCEAVVQRVPTPTDPTLDPMLPAGTGTGGRQFKILQFRWLTDARSI